MQEHSCSQLIIDGATEDSYRVMFPEGVFLVVCDPSMNEL